MFGRCKVCDEKEKRIAQLQDEVAYLRQLASPAHLSVQAFDVAKEADLILSGDTAQSSEDLPPTPAQEELEAEASRILSGNF